MIFAPAITGPTASGKSALAIRIADELGLEIISADSMQIYRGMDIGTAKVTPDEQAQIRHHLIDIVSPSEQFSTFDYRALAIDAARDVNGRGKIPLFVGGTGLYIDTLMRSDAQSAAPQSSREFRERLEGELKTEEDRLHLWQRLNAVDPASAAAIHPNNTRRVIRAIEIFELTGIPKSELDEQSRRAPSELEIFMITLDFHNRDTLYRQIDERVDAMISAGLFDEVKALYESGTLRADTTAGQAIGYKEMLAVIEGGMDFSSVVDEIKLATRRYAKRQLTWFRHNTDAYRIMLDSEGGALRDNDEVFREARTVIESKIKQHK